MIDKILETIEVVGDAVVMLSLIVLAVCSMALVIVSTGHLVGIL